MAYILSLTYMYCYTSILAYLPKETRLPKHGATPALNCLHLNSHINENIYDICQ